MNKKVIDILLIISAVGAGIFMIYKIVKIFNRKRRIVMTNAKSGDKYKYGGI